MNIAIVGSRGIDDISILEQLWNQLKLGFDGHKIISGGAKGVDQMARNFAIAHKIPIIEHIPDWNKYGKKAGYLRNKQIIDECDICIAIWDGSSPGTEHDIRLCKQLKKRLYLYNSKAGKKIIHTYKYDIIEPNLFNDGLEYF